MPFFSISYIVKRSILEIKGNIYGYFTKIESLWALVLNPKILRKLALSKMPKELEFMLFSFLKSKS